MKERNKKLEIYPEDKQLNTKQIVQDNGREFEREKHKSGPTFRSLTKEETKELTAYNEENFVNTDERDA